MADLTGQKFGRLLVLAREPRRGHAYYWCRCECGTEKSIRGTHLTTAAVVACGCRMRVGAAEALTTHGLSDTPEYTALKGARRRCENPKDSRFKDYGGRGIEYRLPDDMGDAVAALVEAIGPRPPGLTLDRIDNDGHYEVGNLRWATRSEQMHNRRISMEQQVALMRAARPLRTQCPSGHLYEGDNVIYVKSGRRCRECARNQWRAAGRRRRVA